LNLIPKLAEKLFIVMRRPLAIKNDLARCIGCQSCADACRAKRVGAIIPNPQTGNPERMCTLCNGDPQCVKYCPYGALSYVVGQIDGRHYGLSPEKIAERLTELWYYHQPAKVRKAREEVKMENYPVITESYSKLI